MTSTIWRVRRDLRLHDNFALQGALAGVETVIPTFVLDPALLAWRDAGPKRVAFMLGGLRAYDADLRARGSRLVVRMGEPGEELARLREETGAGEVHAEADPWPYARERDERVGRRVPLTLAPGITVRPYDGIAKADGSPHTVFTPFSRAWKSLPLPGPDCAGRGVPAGRRPRRRTTAGGSGRPEWGRTPRRTSGCSTPSLQGEKFDRKWVPELALVPQKYVQAPCTTPAQGAGALRAGHRAGLSGADGERSGSAGASARRL